uniref:Uncharacterized protein n=1 Tax=Oryza sativa subsp. japonica TaxID=39947 RepID=Q654G3_ORYSJ|nr:hypothetical protein [Oryza sativa Japonica Group]
MAAPLNTTADEHVIAVLSLVMNSFAMAIAIDRLLEKRSKRKRYEFVWSIGCARGARRSVAATRMVRWSTEVPARVEVGDGDTDGQVVGSGYTDGGVDGVFQDTTTLLAFTRTGRAPVRGRHRPRPPPPPELACFAAHPRRPLPGRRERERGKGRRERREREEERSEADMWGPHGPTVGSRCRLEEGE